MLTTSKSSGKTKRMLVGVISLAFLSAIIVVGFADRITHHLTGSADVPVRSERAARKVERAEARSADETSALPEIPQASPQFDLSRHVIAGGGGTSAGGNIGLSGTDGQASAGTTSSGGQFTVSGGFWQPETGAASTPTPTPTPTPTTTPTPTPSPTPSPTPAPNVVQFSSSNYSVVEACITVTITANRIGNTSSAASVDYFTSDVTASERRDYITAIGTLRFAAGETSKSFVVLINDDSYVEGNRPSM